VFSRQEINWSEDPLLQGLWVEETWECGTSVCRSVTMTVVGVDMYGCFAADVTRPGPLFSVAESGTDAAPGGEEQERAWQEPPG
jgi:hypothetical protein